jgi:hypothetical protein
VATDPAMCGLRLARQQRPRLATGVPTPADAAGAGVTPFSVVLIDERRGIACGHESVREMRRSRTRGVRANPELRASRAVDVNGVSTRVASTLCLMWPALAGRLSFHALWPPASMFHP